MMELFPGHPGASPQMVVEDAQAGSFRVQRAAFIDEEVLQRERAAVFDRCWLYGLHESELAKPGDFVARKVGGKPLLFVRDRSGAIKARP